jgi:DNA mismatch endonuclease (patch repair protein)
MKLETAPSPERSAIMRAIRSSDTAIERQVRSLATGLRCRRNVAGLPGTPDLANKRRRIAVFVHGCYWHRHRCQRSVPKTNTEFWLAKFRANIARDRRVRRRLWALGYAVLVIWECELRRPERVRRKLERLLG